MINVTFNVDKSHKSPNQPYCSDAMIAGLLITAVFEEFFQRANDMSSLIPSIKFHRDAEPF